MRNSAGILCETFLVYRDEQAERSTGGKQRYRQLVPCLCRRKAFRQLARRSKGLGYFQIKILGHAYSYLEMRVRSSGMCRLKSRIGGKGHGTDRREHRASQTVCGRRSHKMSSLRKTYDENHRSNGLLVRLRRDAVRPVALPV